MIKKCVHQDLDVICMIINDAAVAYKNVIPEDAWREPYMPKRELEQEIDAGVVFWGITQDGRLTGVMGIQDKGEVALIRHAYTETRHRNSGIGTQLLQFLEATTDKPILVGTWANAKWAISFYQKNDFRLVSEQEKDRLLRKYWNISERQIETSVVLIKKKHLSE
ncbi:MAG: GNAT family N-acetyltransferase [bacterium]